MWQSWIGRCLEHIGHIGSWPACPEFSGRATHVRSWATLYDTFLNPSFHRVNGRTNLLIYTNSPQQTSPSQSSHCHFEVPFHWKKRKRGFSIPKAFRFNKMSFLEFSGEFVDPGPHPPFAVFWTNLTDPHPTVDPLALDGGHEKHLTALESTRGQVAELKKNHAPGRRFREWLKTVSAKVSAVSMFFVKIQRFSSLNKRRGGEKLWIAE